MCRAHVQSCTMSYECVCVLTVERASSDTLKCGAYIYHLLQTYVRAQYLYISASQCKFRCPFFSSRLYNDMVRVSTEIHQDLFNAFNRRKVN